MVIEIRRLAKVAWRCWLMRSNLSCAFIASFCPLNHRDNVGLAINLSVAEVLMRFCPKLQFRSTLIIKRCLNSILTCSTIVLLPMLTKWLGNDVLVITEIICYRFTYMKINICIFTLPRRLFSSKLPKLNNYGVFGCSFHLRIKFSAQEETAQPFIYWFRYSSQHLGSASCVFMTKSCESISERSAVKWLKKGF